MMCPSCDKDIPDHSVFCLYCGARINVTGEVEHSFMPDSFVSKVREAEMLNYPEPWYHGGVRIHRGAP